MTNAKGIYSIYDTVSEQLLGNQYALMILPHPAAAVRIFQDGLKDEQSGIHKHPTDYNLVRLGFLNEKNELVPEFTTVLTGEAWLASQPLPTPQLVEAK